jgi:hypothetical protein
MRSFENLGFMCLISCPLFVTLSLTILTGGWAIFAGAIAVVLGLLAGGFYAMSAQQRR